MDYLEITDATIAEVTNDWIITAQETRNDDWTFFLAEFNPYFATEEALTLYCWKHHLSALSFTDEVYDRLLTLIDCWYEVEATRHVGGRFSPCTLEYDDQD